MIEPIHQDPADLVLSIVAGKLEAPLTILKQSSLHVGAWTLTFHIIGESHLVTLEHDRAVVLCELLACADVDAASCVHHHPFNDSAAHCFVQSGYSIDVHFDDGEHPISETDIDGTLEVTFPEVAGQTPLTRILWQRVGENAVRWHTLHLYPHQGKIVSVHSLSYWDAVQYNHGL